MSLRILKLSPEEVSELQRPFSHVEAKVAMMAGFAKAISEAGYLPSEAEDFLQKFANQKLAGWADTVANAGVWWPLGLGALGGAYTAYARNKFEQDFDDRGNPELVSIKKKLQTYRTMTDDLKRTNRVEGSGSAVPTAA